MDEEPIQLTVNYKGEDKIIEVHLETANIVLNVAIIRFSSTEDNSKLQDVLKKSTNFSSNYSKNTEDDVFKAEAMKIIKKCETENPENKKQNETGNYNNGYSGNYNNNYYNAYNNESNTRDSDFRNNGYGTNYDYKMNNTNRSNKNSYNNNYEYRPDGNSQPLPFKNCTENKRPNYSSDDDYGHDQRNYNSYRGEGDGNSYFGGAPGYDKSYFSARIRRNDRRNNGNQCISQCVFGYMELMDENQMPSETLVIKWLQDHIANNDLKRIKALREVRRCFAKLSTSDVEDGCQFSKELSNCINLELE